jgi:hypothetical protein
MSLTLTLTAIELDEFLPLPAGNGVTGAHRTGPDRGLADGKRL